MNSALVLPHRHLNALAELIADIGEPCWASGPTSGAVSGFEGCILRPPFHILTTGTEMFAESAMSCTRATRSR